MTLAAPIAIIDLLLPLWDCSASRSTMTCIRLCLVSQTVLQETLGWRRSDSAGLPFLFWLSG